ncbi:hypothetical protein BG004_007696 [Podila humilis]|nr:hypothetical protein BG004_007696 [Podila humilis]
MTPPTENSKERAWVKVINCGRKGAAYFLELENVGLAQPADYFESRDMDVNNQKAIVEEWKGWMATFRESKHRVLIGLAQKDHRVPKAVSKYLLNKILIARKLDLMETSKVQLRDNDAEMTSLLKNVGQSSSASSASLSLSTKQKGKKAIREQPSVSLDEDFQDSAEQAATATTSTKVTSSSSTEAEVEHVSEINETEREELLANIDHASHSVCEWKIDGVCVACSFQSYQKTCVRALVARKIKKSEIADIMAVVGIFAPFLPTERMIAIIGRPMLEEVTVPMILPELVLDDKAIMTAVRLWINNRQEEASEALRGIDRHTRNMIETMFERLPTKQDRTISESTFVVNYVSPVLHGTLKLDPRIYSVHFSEVQKRQGLKPDRPDIVVKARNREILHGEVTGLSQEHSAWKNDWDLFRLARFGKAFLDDGFDVAPLVQVVFSNATYMRLTVETRVEL